MTCTVTIDWKFVAALGFSGVGMYLSSKIDPASAEKVLTCMVDVCMELVVNH